MNTVTITDAVPEMPEEQDGAKSSAALENTKDAPPVDATVIRLPVDARGLSLGILATVAVVFALHWAQDFVASLMLGILFAYTLNPLVVWLEYIKIPRVLSAGIVMIAVLSALLLGAYALQGQVQSILTQLPETASKFSASLASMSASQRDTMKNMQAAATEVAKATNEVAGIAPKQRATHIVIDPPSFEIGNVIWAGSKGVVKFSGQAIVVVFLVFFLLLSAGTFKRKLVRLTGPSLSRRKITKSIIGAEGKQQLDEEVVGKMKQYPQIERVLVTGHADRIGSDTYNLQLSQRRADAVKDYLVEQGVEPARIETASKGESEPVVSCDAVKGKANGRNRELIECLKPNRRVVVEIKVQQPVQK